MTTLSTRPLVCLLILSGLSFSVPVIVLSQHSLGWVVALMVVMIVMLLTRQRPRGGAALSFYVTASVWLVASALSTLTSAGRLIFEPAPLTDDILDLAFAIATATSIVVLLRIAFMRLPRKRPRPPVRWRCCHLARTAVARGLSLLCMLLGVTVVYGAGWELSALASAPRAPMRIQTSRGAIAYWCEGEPRHGAIAVLLGGFMASDQSMAWVQQELAASVTRTCVLYRSGTGWSQRQPSVGFGEDAADVKAVLDAEFDRRDRGEAASGGVARGGAEVPRIAIVGGHSRGFISAASFKRSHAHAYERVLLVSLDGRCDGFRWLQMASGMGL